MTLRSHWRSDGKAQCAANFEVLSICSCVGAGTQGLGVNKMIRKLASSEITISIL